MPYPIVLDNTLPHKCRNNLSPVTICLLYTPLHIKYWSNPGILLNGNNPQPICVERSITPKWNEQWINLNIPVYDILFCIIHPHSSHLPPPTPLPVSPQLCIQWRIRGDLWTRLHPLYPYNCHSIVWGMFGRSTQPTAGYEIQLPPVSLPTQYLHK